jgi:hypothetical protein
MPARGRTATRAAAVAAKATFVGKSSDVESGDDGEDSDDYDEKVKGKRGRKTGAERAERRCV